MFIQGSSKSHTTVNGTSGNDVIVTSGAFTTIYGGGGSDLITTVLGFDVIDIGSINDYAYGTTDSVAMAGPGNTVNVGDESVTVTDLTGGFNKVALGAGTNAVILGGSNNFVTAGVGIDTFVFLGGGNSVSSSSSHPGPDGSYNYTVALAGTANSVTLSAHSADKRSGQFYDGSVAITGGTGGSTVNVAIGTIAIDIGGTYNSVVVGSGGGTITPGSGHDTVVIYAGDGLGPLSVAPSSFTVHLAGQANHVTAIAAGIAIDGGTGSSTFNFTVDDYGQAAFQIHGVSQSVSVTTAGQFNSFALYDFIANTIDTGSGGAHVSIASPTDGIENVIDGILTDVALQATSLTFGGVNNYLDDAGAGTVVATGGTGGGTFILGSGDDSLTTGGTNNSISAGAGSDTINAGSGNDTITLDATNVSATVSGTNDKVTFNNGARGSLLDNAQGLHVYVGDGAGAIDLRNLASDHGFVIDLLGGAGGYATAAQAATAVQSDGTGGSTLALGAGSIHFEGLVSVPAAAFHIG